MDINIKTKFNIDDVVYVFWKGIIKKFKVTDIKTSFGFYNNIEITYRAEPILPADSYVTFTEEFDQNELHTKEELIQMLEQIIKEK